MIDTPRSSFVTTSRANRRSAFHVLVAPVTLGVVIALCIFSISSERRALKSTYLKLKTLNQQTVSNFLFVNHEERPPLSDLLDKNMTRIIGDVQFLLDFAIIAHPKCGTSALLHWIASHSEVRMYDNEIHSLKDGKPAELVSLMYDLPPGSRYKRGLKAPNDLRSNEALESIQTYWPQTKLIIGLRHPVTWMESFYNFRSRKGREVPSEKIMMGLQIPQQVQFHQNLANLGKTNLSANEARLLGITNENRNQHRRMSNDVFLYEISQPSDTNATRASLFRKDLSDFLGFSTPLGPLVRAESKNTHYAIDICDDKYANLRTKLVENGKVAAEWIRTYFLHLSDVTVSSPEYFEELLQSWSFDPCDAAS